MSQRETLYHEKQDHDRLCAVHSVNSLLQGGVFSVLDFSQIAHDLDRCEQQRMAERGTNSVEYQQFIEQPSNNMDDTGFFSVQVIMQALRLWQLDLVPMNSSDEFAQQCCRDHTHPDAYIINMDSHWFCLRKFSGIWFNLDSLLDEPKFMSDLYLAEYLKQMTQERYPIFIVKGDLSRVNV